MIREWKALLSENAREWGLPVKGEWTFLLHNNYQPNYSGVNVFWFHNKTRDPLVVTKVFPEPCLATQEFRNLSDAHTCAPGEVPKPFGLVEHSHSWALWMSGIAGSPLSANLISDSIIDRLCDTLVTIQNGVARKRPAAPSRYRDIVCAPLEFAGRCSHAISEACRRTQAACANGTLDRIPSLPQHGDLYKGNVIVDRNHNWGIVDWELFGNVDLPFYDVVRFLFSVGIAPAPDQWNAAVQQRARRLIQRYSKAIRMQPHEFAFLLPLVLANWHYRQPLPDGKAAALRAMEDYFARPAAWERTMLQ